MLIEEFDTQLDLKDKAYMKAMKQMSDDIEKLINNMKHQYTQMRDDYNKELVAIEQEFDNERADILGRNKKEIEDLFHQHKEIETKYLE